MEKAWLYLEPYTSLTINSASEVLLYNTLNGEQFVTRQPEIAALLRRWQAPGEGHVVSFIPHPVYTPLTVWLRNTFSGDIWAGIGEKPKPVQFAPLEAVTEARLQESRAKMSENLSSLELFFYLHTTCEAGCAFCGTYHKQFPFCKKGNPSSPALGVEEVATVIEALDPGRLQTLHFLGGNLLKYAPLGSLLAYLSNIPVAKAFYIHVCQLPRPEALAIFRETDAYIHLLVSEPADDNRVAACRTYLDASGLEYTVEYVVTNETDADAAACHPDPTRLHPFYTGENLFFFEDNVFIAADDFREPLSLRKIYKHRLVNDSFWGKILIDADGLLYVSPNRPAVGSIGRGVGRAMEKILADDSLWFLTRERVDVCRDCVYNRLCCPVSDYELQMQKFNLCRMRPLDLQNN